jgi:hypothetical protein
MCRWKGRISRIGIGIEFGILNSELGIPTQPHGGWERHTTFRWPTLDSPTSGGDKPLPYEGFLHRYLRPVQPDGITGLPPGPHGGLNHSSCRGGIYAALERLREFRPTRAGYIPPLQMIWSGRINCHRPFGPNGDMECRPPLPTYGFGIVGAGFIPARRRIPYPCSVWAVARRRMSSRHFSR